MPTLTAAQKRALAEQQAAAQGNQSNGQAPPDDFGQPKPTDTPRSTNPQSEAPQTFPPGGDPFMGIQPGQWGAGNPVGPIPANATHIPRTFTPPADTEKVRQAAEAAARIANPLAAHAKSAVGQLFIPSYEIGHNTYGSGNGLITDDIKFFTAQSQTAYELSLQQTFIVFLLNGPDNQPYDHPVTINGFTTYVRTGVPRYVPQSVYEILVWAKMTAPQREQDFRLVPGMPQIVGQAQVIGFDPYSGFQNLGAGVPR